MPAPRLLFPGRLDVVVMDDGVAWIERGALADVPPAVPHQEDLGRVALVPVEGAVRSDLELGAHPFVRTQLERLRWTLTTSIPETRPRLELRGGSPELAWVPPEGSTRRVSVSDPVLWTRLLGDEPDDETVHRWAETGSLQDRICRALTGDAVSLRDLELARWAAGLRSSTLDHEEAILAEVGVRALEQLEAVESLMAALEAADADGDAVELPTYGSATRLVDPPFTLEDGAGVIVQGPPIEVPAEVHYRVEDVEPWEPSASGERRAASFSDWQERIEHTRKLRRRRSLVLWGGLGLGLLVVVGLALAAPLVWSATSAPSAQATDSPLAP